MTRGCIVKQEASLTEHGQKCLKCSKKAVITLPYGPQYFCSNHFVELTEKRVRKTVNKNKLINYGEKVAIGVSGGKDSIVALHILHKLFFKQNSFHAILIDEGIKGYRDKAVKIGVKNCKKLGVEFSVLKFKKEFKTDVDTIMQILNQNPKLGTSCSFCGVFRRRLLNKGALNAQADKLVTGHNLDDETQSILMNIFDGDFNRFARLGPIAGIVKIKEFVPRIKPLYEIPEKEIVAYASFKKLEHYSDECCPYSYQAKRNEFREMLNGFEKKYPGTKHSIIRFFLNSKKFIDFSKLKKESSEKLEFCKKCNSLKSGKICNVCLKLDSIKDFSVTKKT